MTLEQIDELIISGYSVFFTGKFEEATTICNQAFELCRDTIYRQGLAGCHSLNARLLVNARKRDEAIEELLKSIVLLEEIGNTHYKAHQLYLLAICYFHSEQYSVSRQYSEKALEMFREVGDEYGEADALSILASVCGQTSDYKCALEYGLLSYELQIKNNLLNDAGSRLINISTIYSDQAEHSQAINYLLQAIDLKLKYKEAFDSRKEETGSPIYVYNHYTFIKKPNDRTLSDAYINLGTAYQAIGNYTEASQYLQKALEIKRTLGDNYGEAAALNNIGLIFLEIKDYSTAEWYFLQTIPLLEYINNKQVTATLYYNLGIINISNNKIVEANEYLEKSEQLFGEIEYPIGQLMVIEQRAVIALLEKNYKLVFHYLFTGLTLSNLLSAKIFEVMFLSLKGDAYTETGEYDKAISAYNQSVSIAQNQELYSKEAEVLLKLVALHKQCGNLSEALTCLEQYQLIKEKLSTTESEHNLRNMQILHQVELYKTNEELSKAKIKQLEMELTIKQKESELLNQELALKVQTMVIQMEETSRFKSEILTITKLEEKPSEIKRKIVLKLRNSPILRDSWESYLESFRKVHPYFQEVLESEFKDLTSMEVKICILIRAGLRSEVISQILSLSERTIENHRLRLRKKLGLSDSESLGIFIRQRQR
ncbi:MAG: LuxR family transcriptional regulator [Bacteroidetes bacterium]|nr:LuxR family transcriptional regulator [Bacteroidota bacterium]